MNSVSYAEAQEKVQLGKISVNVEEKSLTFPAYVNLEEGILEFLLVHKNGKIHESLFYTEVEGKELNAALILLGYEGETENQETVPILKDLSAHARAQILVARKAPKLKWIPVERFFLYEKEKAPLKMADWRYTGSFFFRDRFISQVEGDLIAIYETSNALINLNHKDRTDDTLWTVHKEEQWKTGDEVLLKILQKESE